MFRLSALVHVVAGLVLSGLFVLVLVYLVPRNEAPIWLFVLAAVLGWLAAIPLSWLFARRATANRREEARLEATDRAEFLGEEPARGDGPRRSSA